MLCQLLWDKAKDFLQRAFTVIFVATHCNLVLTDIWIYI